MKAATALFILFTLLVLSPLDSFANHNQRQNCRMRQGVRSGELTPREVTQVRAEQAKTRNMAEEFKSDGTISPAEKAKLNHREAKMNRNLYQQKHDGQSR